MNRVWIAAASLLVVAGRALPQSDGKARGLAAWDTGRAASEPLSPAALAAKEGWTPLEKETPAVKGDLVLANGRLTVLLRQNGEADLYATPASGPALRAKATLLATSGDPLVKLERLALAEAAKGALTLDLAGKTSKGASIAARLRLKKGDPAFEVDAGGARLRLEAPSRYVVLPDFFADDIVLDAAKIPSASIDAPSENFLLHLSGKEDSIVMAVFENRDQEARLALAGQGPERAFAGSEIASGKGKVWVGLLEGPGIWRAGAIERSQRGRVVPLGWKMPFPAYWRVDLTNTLDLSDSWDMLLQTKEKGEFLRPTWFGEPLQKVRPNRQMYDQAIGGMIYPAFADPQGNGFVQGFWEKGRNGLEVTHLGPVLLYPINRLPDTPLEAFTVVDLMRNTLGVGPCEHILDVEGLKQQSRGRATCSVRVEVNQVYAAGQQKSRRADVEQFLKQGETFVKYIRGRIEGYVEAAHGMLDFIAAKKKAEPSLAATFAPLEKILRQVDAAVEGRKDRIKMPEDHARHFAEFRGTLLGAEGPEVVEKVKAWCDALADIGGNQDELVGHCRWVMKNVRQKAGLIAVQDPKAAPVALEVRAKAQESLRNPSAVETSRH